MITRKDLQEMLDELTFAQSTLTTTLRSAEHRIEWLEAKLSEMPEEPEDF